MADPRVLHLNDCAFVGANLVKAAERQGHRWAYLPTDDLRPAVGPEKKLRYLAGQAVVGTRFVTSVWRSQVMHVHFANTAKWLEPAIVPKRPHVIHIHGTDLRELWTNPATHADIQRYLDKASHVFYSTPDLAEKAERAYPGAEYMPIFFDPEEIPEWNPGPVVVFPSRWDPVKGASRMLEVARLLRSARPDLRLEGLDWGEQASEARAAGIHLRPHMDHAAYLRWLAGASVAVGQTGTVIGVSEMEALAIGLPLVVGGTHLPGPDGEPLPLLEGTPSEQTDTVLQALEDPPAVSARLGGREWAHRHHTADPQIPRLVELYRQIARR